MSRWLLTPVVLLACSPTAPAPPPRVVPVTPVTPFACDVRLSTVEVPCDEPCRAAIARDGLLAPTLDLAEPTLAGVFAIEVDASPPAERIVQMFERGGEGTWADRYVLYDAAWNQIAGPLEHGDYLDRGYQRVGDLDADGRDELVIVGGTDGVSAAKLSIYSWSPTGFGEVGGDPSGVAYVFDDLDCDGRREIVALDLAVEEITGDSHVVVRVIAPGGDGSFGQTDDSDPRLVHRLLDVVTRGLAPVEPALPLVVRAMRERSLRPSDLALLRNRIAALYPDTERYSRAALIDALVWPGQARAGRFLRELLDQDAEDTPTIAVAHALAAVGDELDQTHLRLWLMQKLESDDALGFAVIDPWRAALRGYVERGDPALRDLVEQWIEHGDAPIANRAVLLRWVGPTDEGFAPLVLRLHRDGPAELRNAAADVLAEAVQPWSPRAKQWSARTSSELELP